jgi:hypothetical protein
MRKVTQLKAAQLKVMNLLFFIQIQGGFIATERKIILELSKTGTRGAALAAGMLGIHLFARDTITTSHTMV